MNYTDGAVLLLCAFFFYRGWKKGFLRSILGPICLILGCILAYVHYAQNADKLMALLIGIFAPFVLHLGLGFLVKMIQKNDEQDNGSGLSPVSRLLGGVFKLSWQGPITILILLLIALMPFKIEWLMPIQKSIRDSLTYEVLNSWTGEQMPKQHLDMDTMREVMENPETIEEVRNTESYQKVMANARIQDLLEDKEIQKDIQSQNILALMKNEKIQAIMEDETLLEDLFALQHEILKQTTK